MIRTTGANSVLQTLKEMFGAKNKQSRSERIGDERLQGSESDEDDLAALDEEKSKSA